MRPHESPRINKKPIRGDSGDSWPVWNRGIRKPRVWFTFFVVMSVCVCRVCGPWKVIHNPLGILLLFVHYTLVYLSVCPSVRPSVRPSVYIHWLRRRCILQENTVFDVGVNVTCDVAQQPLHHVTYALTKFEVATANCLEGDAFTRKYILWPWP